MGYKEEFAELLARRAAGEITVEEFQELRDKLVESSPTNSNGSTKTRSTYQPKMPSEHKAPKQKRTSVPPLIVILVLVVLGGGLWFSGVFNTKARTKLTSILSMQQWVTANQTQFEALTKDVRAVGSLSHDSRKVVIRKLTTLGEFAVTLSQSGCPDWHLRTDFNNVTQASFRIGGALQTHSISLSSPQFIRDIQGLNTYLIALYEKFNAITPAHFNWGTTITTAPKYYAQDLACRADAETIEVAIAAYQVQSGNIGRETNIVLGSPSTYSSGHFAKLLLHSGNLISWPHDTNGYAISLSQNVAGNVAIYVPANSKHPIDFEIAKFGNGCSSPTL